MIGVELCPACWRRLGPLLLKQTQSEAAHLRIIAAQLRLCADCRRHAPALSIEAAKVQQRKRAAQARP